MLKRILQFFRGEKKQDAATMSNWGLDASRLDDSWGYLPWPLDSNDEWDAGDLQTTYKRARSLYENCAPIRAAVEQMVRYTGVITPLPATTDEEWNELALAEWNRRTKNPNTFDTAGRVNYRQAMRFLERCAIIDGDAAVVPTYAADGGAAFAFFRAHQIAGGGVNGVEVDAWGRPTAYHISQDGGMSSTPIPAWQVVLYQHNADPTRYRGHTMLAAALRNGKDVTTMVGYAKAGAKLSSSMGLVATRAAGTRAPEYATNVGGNAKKNNGPAARPLPKQLLGTGLNITNLPEGVDLKTISDGRPSTQLQAFFKFLIGCIAQGAGFPPELLLNLNELTGAGIRFALEVLRRYQRTMAEDQELVGNRVYQHVIACAIKQGRLRPCRDANWANVRWIQEQDMTIDPSRVASAEINLVRELLADPEEWTLKTTGKTPQQLAKQIANIVAYQKQVAEQNGLTLDELRRGVVGTTPTPSTQSTEGTPRPLPDIDPEEPEETP